MHTLEAIEELIDTIESLQKKAEHDENEALYYKLESLRLRSRTVLLLYAIEDHGNGKLG